MAYQVSGTGVLTPQDQSTFQQFNNQIIARNQNNAAQAQAAEDQRNKERDDSLAAARQYTNTSQEANTRNQLAGQIANIKSGSNSRGLLYSGMNQAAQGGARAGAKAQIASNRANVNAASQDQLAGLQGQDLQNAMSAEQNQINTNQALYKQALDKKKQEQQAGSSLGSGIGNTIGSVASALTGGLL